MRAFPLVSVRVQVPQVRILGIEKQALVYLDNWSALKT